MKKMIMGAFALCLTATTALAENAGGAIVGGSFSTPAPGSGDSVLVSAITVNSAANVISANGDYSVNFGSINAGNVINSANFVNSPIAAPSLTLSPGSYRGETTPDITLYATSHTAIGATTYYESGFAPVILTKSIPYGLISKGDSFQTY